jgi:hypothetical protein
MVHHQGGGDPAIGGHKMHIFTANIPTFYLRYRRYVFITNEFHEFCWSTFSGISDDGKALYGPKSMHIFNMSKIRHSHREYDTRGWCGIKSGPNRAKMEPTGPTSLVGRPGVGAFSNSSFPTCQGRSMHMLSNAQSRCSHEIGCPATLAS